MNIRIVVSSFTKVKMSNEEEKDLELKDLLVQTLESNGILSKLKVPKTLKKF
jgi:hypothetical protein